MVAEAVLKPGLGTRADAGMTASENFWVLCPDNPGMDRARVPAERRPEHSLLRPFDRLSARGSPPGWVRYGILWLDGDTALVVYAVAITGLDETKPFPRSFRRLLLFPGCRAAFHFPTRQPAPRALPIHHITLEWEQGGALAGHVTVEPRLERAKERWLSSWRTGDDREGFIPLGVMGVRAAATLDRAGFAYAPARKGLLHGPQSGLAAVHGALAGSHPVHTLPRGTLWESAYHLQVAFYLARSYPQPMPSGIPRIKVPGAFEGPVPLQRAWSSASAIPMGTGFLVVALTLLPGEPKGWDAYWAPQQPKPTSGRPAEPHVAAPPGASNKLSS